MKDPVKSTEVGLHPASGHRTPKELDKDSEGRMSRPDLDVLAGQHRIPSRAKLADGDTDVSPLGKPSEPE
jgi:hypothetical protein